MAWGRESQIRTITRNFAVVASGEVTGGLNPHPYCLPGPLMRFAQNRWENIVPANTLVLVARVATFSESQWNQFHPRAKKPTASRGFPWPQSAALPLDPAGDSAAHSSPCTFSLTPPAELHQNKQPKRSHHFVTNHYICKNVIMRLIFKRLTLL